MLAPALFFASISFPNCGGTFLCAAWTAIFFLGLGLMTSYLIGLLYFMAFNAFLGHGRSTTGVIALGSVPLSGLECSVSDRLQWKRLIDGRDF